jgi:nucleoid-associated protein YgaU
MADLATLQQKYEPVLKAIDRFTPEGAQLQDVSLEGDKLHVKAILPSQVTLNFVWDQIKKVDAQYADLQHELVNTGGQDQPYTTKPGDMLSKIAQHFYGDGNLYGIIAKANGIADPNKLSAGTLLSIPVRTS